jgi:hypothetical protein
MDRITLRQLSRESDNDVYTKAEPLTSADLDGNFLFLKTEIDSVGSLINANAQGIAQLSNTASAIALRVTALENGSSGSNVDLSNYYTKVEVDNLIPDVFSGDYADLTNKPTIPSDVADLTDNTGLIGSGGSEVSLARSTASITTAELAPDQVELVDITNAAKSYAIMKIEVSGAAWIRVYSTDAARTADGSRLESADPDPGSGVLAEIITTSAGVISFTPATIGFNDEDTPVNTIYLAVTNKGSTLEAITTDFTFLPLEI